MKIILVSPEIADSEHVQTILDNFGRSGDMLFQYHHPLKAIDNIEEILPDLVLWSHSDFPRHWKTMIPYLEGIEGTSSMKLILYSHSKIGQAEIDKAQTLKVDAIIQQGLSSPQAVDIIDKLLVDMPGDAILPPSDVAEKPAERFDMNRVLNSVRYIPSKSESIQLTMSHPVSLKILSGRVTALDLDSIKFTPAKSDDFANLPDGTLLQKCHLRIREHKLQLDLKIKITADNFDLAIQDPAREYLPLLTQLLDEENKDKNDS